MGASVSRIRNQVHSLQWPVIYGRKRKLRDRNDDGESDDSLQNEARSCKRRKLISTAEYIFKTLFQEGQNSDVTIEALGHTWKLHKVYLCQSPYFSSMFSGSWNEADKNVISVGIEDPNITIDSLSIIFGSFYKDELVVDEKQVIAVLAAAVLFQLDHVITHCTEIMYESLHIKNVLDYLEAAELYGLKNLYDQCFRWFTHNLMASLPDSLHILSRISPELMESLVPLPDLIVLQTEFSLYLLLRAWVFLRENPKWEGDKKEVITDSQKYFRSIEGKTAFLNTLQGQKYLSCFRSLRLQHLISHSIDVELIESDHIIPVEWMLPIFRDQWFAMLRVDQGVDRGPKQIPDDEFLKHCLRCGRILCADTQHSWRWTGFNFGLDLVVTYYAKSIRFRRNVKSDVNLPMTSYHQQQNLKRHIMYRLTVCSLDERGSLKYHETTGIQTISLAKNEEVRVFTFDKCIQFPIIVSANFLVISPNQHCKGTTSTTLE